MVLIQTQQSQAAAGGKGAASRGRAQAVASQTPALPSVAGDEWVLHLAKLVKKRELAYFGKLNTGAPQAKAQPIAASTSTSSAWNPLTWVGAGSSSADAQRQSASGQPARSSAQSRAPTPATRTEPLSFTPHHLFYLLIRFEAVPSLPSAGSLDIQLPEHPLASRSIAQYIQAPPSSFASASNGTRSKQADDAVSLSSFRSILTAPNTLSSAASSWFGSLSSSGTSSNNAPSTDPTRNLRLLYALLGQLPSLRIGPVASSGVIREMDPPEDCPGQNAIPLDLFKSLTHLHLEGVDPRGLIGWDRLAIQLRELYVDGCDGVEDVGEVLVDAVIMDAKRRRGEKVGGARRRRVVHSALFDQSLDQQDLPGAAAIAPAEAEPGEEREKDCSSMPSLAWHFLRHLSLSCNSLTFLPEPPLHHLSNLRSLDLSSNLLNSVPPSLHLLPSLASLNLRDNLIESVLGISTLIPSIRTLILANNRLSSLCGVERLHALHRIDLRANHLFDPGELGRLAPLRSIAELWVGPDNPIVEEWPDWRVEVLLEFEKEKKRGEERSIKLDGQEAGFFERQRVAERLAEIGHVAPTGDDSVTAEAPAEAASNGAQPEVAAIRIAPVKPVHRRAAASRQRGDKKDADERGRAPRRDGSSSSEQDAQKKSGSHRRHVRHVDLSSPKNASALMPPPALPEAPLAASPAAHNETESGHGAETSDYLAMSDSEAIKAAVLAGHTSLAASPNITAVDGKPTEKGRPRGLPRLASRDVLSVKSSALASVSTSEVTSRGGAGSPAPHAQASDNAPNAHVTPETDITTALIQNLGAKSSDAPIAAEPRTLSRTLTVNDELDVHVASSRSQRGNSFSGGTPILSTPEIAKPTVSKDTAASGSSIALGVSGDDDAGAAGGASSIAPSAHMTQNAATFRRGLEALRGEMGDDWLTLLARGEYKPDGSPTKDRPNAGRNNSSNANKSRSSSTTRSRSRSKPPAAAAAAKR